MGLLFKNWMLGVVLLWSGGWRSERTVLMGLVDSDCGKRFGSFSRILSWRLFSVCLGLSGEILVWYFVWAYAIEEKIFRPFPKLKSMKMPCRRMLVLESWWCLVVLRVLVASITELIGVVA